MIGASPSVLSHRIQPEEAVAVIHHGLAGTGQVLLGDFVNMSASARDQSGEIQLAQMLGRVVVAAAGHLGQFGNGARLAAAQFLDIYAKLRERSALKDTREKCASL